MSEYDEPIIGDLGYPCWDHRTDWTMEKHDRPEFPTKPRLIEDNWDLAMMWRDRALNAEEALRPFGLDFSPSVVDLPDDVVMTIHVKLGDIRRARSALAQWKE